MQILRSEKDTLESVLTMKTADVKKSLSNELVRIEEEMYFTIYIGRDISISKRPRIVVFNSKSLHSRARRQHFSNNFLDYKGE